MTEMLVAKLPDPDPPSEDPNEDDVKDEEILRKLSKLKKFNKKWLDNENSAPVEEKVRVADNVLKEVEETGVPKVDKKRAEVMKAKVETADDTISEEKEHPSVEESVEINEVNTDVEKEEDKFESVEVKNKIASKPLDRSALDTNDEALDADENDHDVNESDKLEERKFCETKKEVKSSIRKIVKVKQGSIEEEVEKFNDDALEKASKLKLVDEEENLYKKGFVLENTLEILTMGHAVMLVNARAEKVKEQQEFSNYLISPNKFKFGKFVRVLSIVAACQIVKRILKMLEVMYKLICLVLNSLMPKILSLKACLTSLGCWRWQTTRLSYWRQCPSALDNFMSVLCSVNMDLVVAVEVDETASADKHYGVRPCLRHAEAISQVSSISTAYLRLCL